MARISVRVAIIEGEGHEAITVAEYGHDEGVPMDLDSNVVTKAAANMALETISSAARSIEHQMITIMEGMAAQDAAEAEAAANGGPPPQTPGPFLRGRNAHRGRR